MLIVLNFLMSPFTYVYLACEVGARASITAKIRKIGLIYGATNDANAGH